MLSLPAGCAAVNGMPGVDQIPVLAGGVLHQEQVQEHRPLREQEPEAQLAGPGPCIHHIGIEVEDRETTVKKITDNGGPPKKRAR